MSHECPREHHVVAAVRRRAWQPEDDDLRRHVAACATCAETAAVCDALALAGDHDRPHLPSAGEVWHRATLRARAEGVQAASRSLVWAYGVAGAAAVGLTAALVGPAWPRLVEASKRIALTVPSQPLTAEGPAGWVSAAVHSGVPFVAGAAACVALASVAVYVAVRGDQKL